MGKPKNARGQGTPATVALSQAGVDFTLHPYEHDAGAQAYGEEAADALGVPYGRIFKTLVAEVDGGLAVAVVPVAGKLDLKALAAALGGKRAAMADAAKVERVTGYVVGGISPLGQRRRLPTVVDASALGFETVYFSAGRRGLQIETAPAELVRLTQAVTAPIGRSG
ncbi:Cys-tRNA(Pro)/Cys-tRNA(Cys) deacylase [Planomonospora parontospora subsp. parontospora]|uniref:Cys-tRNA(Pro)/Cys-tRNA(Cys) deacylase n=2 Tax=Planomonospora parontospora TaxID=58119 RepID=A0AA37BC25_9ACTN|nr:Cys-tRNA(Pro) deacylase [Planomonospora parontospora]GGK48099.1 Cys-tRNA(Pro)/Cys-tRNA(Cys) deacylase [Planomonospora parontospora]GII06675.1 Cys-tRNA(Pro)/Cys-tRNA(Cys) deacylase [Planomonospora parontospora subsp. parontospora]